MNMDTAPIEGGGGGGDAEGGGGCAAGNVPAMQSSRDAVTPSPTPHTECDISLMSDSPMRRSGHRRALSDIIGLPDDLDLGASGDGDGPALSDENEEELFSMFLDVEKLNSRCGASESSESSCAMAGGGGDATQTSAAPGAGLRLKHRQRNFTDASNSIEGYF